MIFDPLYWLVILAGMGLSMGAQLMVKGRFRKYSQLGTRSRMVITGDVTQIDLHHKVPSGLVRALDVLDGTDGIGVARMQATDIVRHPLVARIVKAWSEDDRQRRRERST